MCRSSGAVAEAETADEARGLCEDSARVIMGVSNSWKERVPRLRSSKKAGRKSALLYGISAERPDRTAVELFNRA